MMKTIQVTKIWEQLGEFNNHIELNLFLNSLIEDSYIIDCVIPTHYYGI